MLAERWVPVYTHVDDHGGGTLAQRHSHHPNCIHLTGVTSQIPTAVGRRKHLGGVRYLLVVNPGRVHDDLAQIHGHLRADVPQRRW
jgi:hypothetical protein